MAGKGVQTGVGALAGAGTGGFAAGLLPGVKGSQQAAKAGGLAEPLFVFKKQR